MKWVAHRQGSQMVHHLTSSWARHPGQEARNDPYCGLDRAPTVERPDGKLYCRHCLGFESLKKCDSGYEKCDGK